MRAPYGAWKSPITTDLMTARAIGLSNPRIVSGALYWLEGRPLEGGRAVVVRRGPDGEVDDVTPEEFNVRTRVHEYGGGAYCVRGETVFFSNYGDQRLYRVDAGEAPIPLTPEPATPAGERYADATVSPDGRWIVCVRETHSGRGEPTADLVCLPPDGSEAPRTLVRGSDFYSFPRLSPDGRRLAWSEWTHPRMPWDGTTLKVGRFSEDGALEDVREIAGGPEESIFQPGWSADGVLHFVSDRTGWWNLYRESRGEVTPLRSMEAEFGAPQWVFGMSTYAFLSGERIACIYVEKGVGHLAILEPSGELREIRHPSISSIYQPELRSDDGSLLVFTAGSPSHPQSVSTYDVDRGELEVVRKGLDCDIDPGYISEPEFLEFPTEGQRTAFAFYYPPTNQDCSPPDAPEGKAEEKPPLLVVSHGGPTGSTNTLFNLGIQFWTSRGFAVVDVNYGGSTGYGREYRERLRGQWGVVDTQDCIRAAQHLVDEGRVDGRRLAIRGGSAGGYTTLCALVFHDVFAAGASYYGVADLEALARDTHKFESRYLDGLIGPYPEARALYRERAPTNHTDRLSCPVILLQGLEDRVVPPSQAELLVTALRRKNLPFAYLAFEGEQHGFRKAETIRRALEAELYFYGRIFGFEPADDLAPVEIENLEAGNP
ncbi:MAG: prolyl oligopeptidase family serine peptidase [Planctomycetota bacterium]|nr:prolyl oligopeptidase family serine peptidase [Planctomycetota bacterium]